MTRTCIFILSMLGVVASRCVVRAHVGSKGHPLHDQHHQNRTLRLETPVVDLKRAANDAFFLAYNHDEVLSGPGNGDHFCGSPSPNAKELVKTEALVRRFQESQANGGRRAVTCNGCIVIDTYVHVITDPDETLGNVSDVTIQSQMEILNASFAGSPFQFALKGTTRTRHASFFNLEATRDGSISSMQAELGALLRQGDRTTLNMYTATFRPAGLGVASFPTAYEGFKDGVFLDHCTLPEGSCPPYSTGEIPVHEVGHWLGLLHVFEGGCNEEKGDFVADTPAQAFTLYSCDDPPSDSCPDLPGLDPVSNYMGYSAECFGEFTPGQWERMYDQWYIYRDGSGGCDEDEGILSVEIKLDSNPQDNFWRLYHADGQLISLASFARPDQGSMYNAQICVPYEAPIYFVLGDSMSNGLATDPDSFYRLYYDGKPLKDDRTFESWSGAAFTMVSDAGCPSGEGLVVVELLLDDYPRETTWWIEDERGSVVYTEDEYKLLGDNHFYKHASVRRELCLPADGYSFIIQDSYGDGLGMPGPGDTPFFRITANDVQVIDETGFASKEQIVSFTIEASKGAIVFSTVPTPLPSQTPTIAESAFPSMPPSLSEPSISPSMTSSFAPSQLPTVMVSDVPSTLPSLLPTQSPSNTPSQPPSPLPSISLSEAPSQIPSLSPSTSLTKVVSSEPSISPSMTPSVAPSQLPTVMVSEVPSTLPSLLPTQSPSNAPSHPPTSLPSMSLSEAPSHLPSILPSKSPSSGPTIAPAALLTSQETPGPTTDLTKSPTAKPTKSPTGSPTSQPTPEPTAKLTELPTVKPTSPPTESPTFLPTSPPSTKPTGKPTFQPTSKPTKEPTELPTWKPTSDPTTYPSAKPTELPTRLPTNDPTEHPSPRPTELPTWLPTSNPTAHPSAKPTELPTRLPTNNPTARPSARPTELPTWLPTFNPTAHPSTKPTELPTWLPTNNPTTHPSAKPTKLPTWLPAYNPTAHPSTRQTVAPTLEKTPVLTDDSLQSMASFRKSRTIERDAIADAYVRAGSSANTNLGVYGTLDVKVDTNVDNRREAYIAFDISEFEIGDIVEAQFRVVPRDIRGDPPNTISMYGVDETWEEDTITYSNKPSFSSKRLAVLIALADDKPIFVDLTSYIQQAIEDGRGIVSFALLADPSDAMTKLYARESDSDLRPKMLFAVSDKYVVIPSSLAPSSAPLPDDRTPLLLHPSELVERECSADSYVRGGDNANARLGRESDLVVKVTEYPSNYREVYVAFDIVDFAVPDKILAASFRLVPKDIRGDPPNTISLHAVDETWDEDSINYSNKPNYSNPRLAVLTAFANDKDATVDLTDYVKEAIESGKDTISFALLGSPGDQMTKFYSKEAGDGKQPTMLFTVRTDM